MPAGDRTGPIGQGPMTGRGAGYCAGYDAPGYAAPVPGRGCGWGGWRGGGWGRGFGGWRGSWEFGPARYGRRWTPVAPPPDEEVEMLRRHAQGIQAELERINRRIDELTGDQA
ncbi:MAG: DUF5320 domain-containing protein [Anaerolineae bacterium]|nr:DUF5320 domain-containing protein [Anaerolineae bacterium]